MVEPGLIGTDIAALARLGPVRESSQAHRRHGDIKVVFLHVVIHILHWPSRGSSVLHGSKWIR